jgi:hypothetical protein
MSNRTDRYQLVEARLGENLEAWVAERRRPGIRPPASWRDIAAELSKLTGIAVSHEALRVWFPEYATEPVPTAEPAGGQR